MGLKNSKYEIDISKAKALVRKCLTEDFFYQEYLNNIMKLDKYHFKELFKGNTKLDYINNKSFIFSLLLQKFEQFNKILYNFHKDESSYNEVALLWKSDINISSLYNLSYEEFDQKLNDINLSLKFKGKLKQILDNTIEAKASEIVKNMKEEHNFLYRLFLKIKNEKEKLDTNGNMDNNGLYSNNLYNILNGLVYSSFPLIQIFLSKIPNLEPLSKSEIKTEITSKLKDEIIKEYAKQEKNSYIHEKLIDFVKDFKNGDFIQKCLNGVKNFYSSPLICLAHIALGILNLINSIKNFNHYRTKFKQDKTNFSREFSKIISDFEIHKNEIGILKLNKESIEKIREVHDKIKSDLTKLRNFISKIKNEMKKIKENRSDHGIVIATNVIGFLSSLVGAAFTGGATLFVYLGAAALNGAAIGINSAVVCEMNEQLDFYEKLLKEGKMKKYR